MAATLIPEKIYAYKGFTDDTVGPYADVAALGDITNLFVGLSVMVLSPYPMECWLPKRAVKSGWRIKRLAPVTTYAELISISNTLFSSLKTLVEKGMEATVTADETNDGKVTKYIVTNRDSSGIVWERVSNGGTDITIDGDDATAPITLKGFKVVTLETYLAAVESGATDGYLWFVRDFSGDTVISSAIYFEDRKYAETNNGGGGSDARVDNIIASLGRIVNANGQWSGFFPTHALLWNTNSVEEALVALETAIIDNKAVLDGKVDKEVYESAITAINEAIISDEEAISSLADEIALKANRADVYTKSEIDAKIAGAFHFRGTASGLSEDKTVITGLDAGDGITASTENIGDVYQIGYKEFASNGNIWVELGMDIDLSPIYAKLAELESTIATVSESVEELDEALSVQIEKVASLEKTVGNTALPSGDTITNIINSIITVTGDDF